MAAMIIPEAEAAAPRSMMAIMDRAISEGPGIFTKKLLMVSKEGAASMA